MYVKIVGREVPFPLVVRKLPPPPGWCLVLVWCERRGISGVFRIW